MILHVLPGDAYVSTFETTGIEGDVAVCREALIEGDISGDDLPEFWERRASYFEREDTKASSAYHESVVREFAKLTALQSGSEINLWFEYELFCQVNMWFCLNLLAGSTADIYRVAPVILSEEEVWDGFGRMTAYDLEKCFASRIQLNAGDVDLGSKLWIAYKTRDLEALESLSMNESAAFPKLREACIAAMEQDSKPREIITEIVARGETDFESIFREFKSRAGEFGYGDAQVKRIWESLLV